MPNGIDESPYRLNSYLKTVPEWGPKEIEERTQQLCSIAGSYWAYPHTDFEPPVAVLPTEPLGENESFRGRTIVAYEFGDVKETVESWADMLPRLLSVLLQQYRPEILDFAADSSNYVVASHGMLKVPREYRKVDEGFAVYTASSTNDKTRLIRALFEHLDIDPDELVFTFRPETTDLQHDDEGADTSPYSALTKFEDRFDELVGQSVTADDTAELREEFLRDFTPFKRIEPAVDMGDRMLPEFEKPEVVSGCGPEQILAAVTTTIQAAEIYDPLALHNKITSGVASMWLRRLRESPTSKA